LQAKFTSAFKNHAIRSHEAAPHQFCSRIHLLPDLGAQLDPRQALYLLAKAIDWKSFEEGIGPLYTAELTLFETLRVSKSGTHVLNLGCLIAQIYNWWSLYARLVDRESHRKAVTTRPELFVEVSRRPSTLRKPGSA
jgi:hypothetical protein